MMGIIHRADLAARFTLTEAAVIVGLPRKRVRRYVDDGTVPVRVRSPGLRFGAREVFVLLLRARIRTLKLPKSDWKDLAELVLHRRESSGRWSREREHLAFMSATDERFEVDFVRIRADAARRALRYWRGKRRIVRDPLILGGEPVFRGTRIPVAHVAALLRKGSRPEEILEDFPSLNRDDLGAAGSHAEVGPPPGRPRRLVLLRTAV